MSQQVRASKNRKCVGTGYSGAWTLKELLIEKEKTDRKEIEAKIELGWKTRRLNALKELHNHQCN